MHALAKYCRKWSFGFQFRSVNIKLNKLIFCREEGMEKLFKNGIEGYGGQFEALP